MVSLAWRHLKEVYCHTFFQGKAQMNALYLEISFVLYKPFNNQILGTYDFPRTFTQNLWVMMMMMNCCCGMDEQRKAISLISSRDHCQRSPSSRTSDTPRGGFSPISSRDHCQRSSLSRISDTPRAGFEPVQSLSSGLVEWSCAIVITTTPRRCRCSFSLYCQKKLAETSLGGNISLKLIFYLACYVLDISRF